MTTEKLHLELEAHRKDTIEHYGFNQDALFGKVEPILSAMYQRGCFDEKHGSAQNDTIVERTEEIIRIVREATISEIIESLPEGDICFKTALGEIHSSANSNTEYSKGFNTYRKEVLSILTKKLE